MQAKRLGGGIYSRISAALAIILAALCFYYYMFPGIDEFTMRAAFLGFIMVLCFLPKDGSPLLRQALDLLLCAVSVAVCVYIVLYNDAIKVKFLGLSVADIVMGAAMIVLILEATRRKSGWAMPVIAALFILYGFFGYLIPGRYSASHFSVSRIISMLYTGTEGIFGSALARMLSTIYIFIIFGGLLETTGAGSFIIDIAKSACGGAVGSTAKIAAISAMLFGSISGSAVANTAATGSFTIPMMKDSGYSSRFAGAVSAVASTGGQIMPPVMGAGAFLIAEMVGVPYDRIVLISFLPALMFYGTIFAAVHFEAKRTGLSGLPADQIPRAWTVIKSSGITALPLLLLLGLVIFSSFSVVYSALISTAVLIAIGFIRSGCRVDFLVSGIISCVSSVVSTAICCACAGLVIGMISLTGLDYSFSSTLVNLSQGSMLLGLLISLLLSIILGMGLPTTPAFILAACVAGPGLISMGLSPVVAYIVLFWFSQTSNITPPVCMAAYTAAAICGESPIKVGVASLKLGAPIVIIPFLMVYRDLLFTGSVFSSVMSVCMGSVGLFCFVLLIVGFLRRPFRTADYVIAAAAALGTFWPSYVGDAIGIAAFLLLLLLQRPARSPQSL